MQHVGLNLSCPPRTEHSYAHSPLFWGLLIRYYARHGRRVVLAKFVAVCLLIVYVAEAAHR